MVATDHPSSRQYKVIGVRAPTSFYVSRQTPFLRARCEAVPAERHRRLGVKTCQRCGDRHCTQGS